MITFKLTNGELYGDIVGGAFVITNNTNDPFCSLEDMDIKTYRLIRQWLPIYNLIKEAEQKYYAHIRTKQTLKRGSSY